MFRFESSDRSYSSWELVEIAGDGSVTPDGVDPLANRWITGDLVSCEFRLVKSPVREGELMAGILVLSGSTYGRDLNGKLRYKCVPDDPRYPVFLVSYAAKDVGFSKKKVDRFVTFQWKDWSGKHPECFLVENIGYVTDNQAFYEYQLRRRGLLAAHLDGKKPRQLRVTEALSAVSENDAINGMFEKWGLEDRTDRRVVTVDPAGCRDFDDALGWEAGNGKVTASVYIANVPVWIEHLGLWGAIGGLPATVYLPHRTIPMLPPALANNLCSLVSGKRRPALALDVSVSESGSVSMSYSVCVVNVSANYSYDDSSLETDPVYAGALSVAEVVREGSPYVTGRFDSHTLIAFYMMLMNARAGELLGAEKTGIARTHPGSAPVGLAGCVGRVAEGYHGGSARYVPGGRPDDLGHALVGDGVPHYMHTSSPIRRRVDIVNMVMLHTLLGLVPHGGAALAYVHMVQTELADVNAQMAKISRVQTECRILQVCTERPSVLDSEHAGVVIDTMCDVLSPGVFSHSVYMKDLEIMYRYKSEEPLELYGTYRFAVHVFRDEHTLNRKLKLSLCDSERVLAGV